MVDAFDRLKTALADRYTIERELGRGGMATVYLAHDLKHDRKVAVKVLRPELSASIGVDRFLREIKIAANFHHPHILPLHDSGEADGFLFYVMPFVEGGSLRNRLNCEKQLPIGDALKIAGEVADALGTAHRHNCIHRDIKPENILLDEGHAVVADFGVARAVEEAGETRLTETGVAIGTPAYLSPEQATGERELDGRSDIYALGCVLYEMLAGQPPFTGPTAESIVQQHLVSAPRAASDMRATVPVEVVATVSKALAKAPADRYQTATEFGEALANEQVRLLTPSGGTTSPGMKSVDRRVRRGWMMLGSALGVAGVIAVIVVVAAYPSSSSVRLNPNHVVVAQFRNQTGDSSLNQLGLRIGHWITQGVQQAGIPTTPWDQALHAWEYVQTEADDGRVRDPVRALAEETGAGVVVSGAVYVVRGDSVEIQVDVTDAIRRRSLGNVDPVRAPRAAEDEAITKAQQLVMVFLAPRFDEYLGDFVPTNLMGAAPNFEAYQAYTEGVRALAEGRSGGQAIEYHRRAFELDSTWTPPLFRLLMYLNGSGRKAERDSVMELLESRWDRLSPYERAELQSFRGLIAGDADEWVRHLRRAAQLAPGSVNAWNLASALPDRNRPHEAQQVLATINPESGVWRSWGAYWIVLADVYLALDQPEEALTAIERGLRKHPDLRVNGLQYRAQALAVLGRVQELRSLLDEIDIGADIEGIRNTQVEGIEALRVNGHVDAAGELAQERINWFERRPADEAATVQHRYWYGRLLFVAGRVDEAQAIFDQLVEESAEVVSTSDWLNVRTTRGFIAAMRGDTVQALADMAWFENQPGNTSLEQGIIAGALGRQEKAITLLREGAQQHPFKWFQRIRVLFDPVRDHADFQELIKPKG